MSRAKLIPLSVWLLIAVASSVSNSQERGFIRSHSINLRPTDAVVLNTKQDVDVQTVQSRPSKRSSIGQLTVKEKELLNCFMARLKREPTATGWIRIDLERRRVDEPSLTDLVTLYLMTKHNRDFKRVSIMGTYRLDQEMELFIIPSGEDAIPFPEKTAKAKCSTDTISSSCYGHAKRRRVYQNGSARWPSFGTVSIGQRADLLLLQANPLTQIDNISQIAGVMVKGRWLRKRELEQMRRDMVNSFNR